MASKIAQSLRRYPALMFVLLVAFSLIAAKCGHPHRGLWDGPI